MQREALLVVFDPGKGGVGQVEALAGVEFFIEAVFYNQDVELLGTEAEKEDLKQAGARNPKDARNTQPTISK